MNNHQSPITSPLITNHPSFCNRRCGWHPVTKRGKGNRLGNIRKTKGEEGSGKKPKCFWKHLETRTWQTKRRKKKSAKCKDRGKQKLSMYGRKCGKTCSFACPIKWTESVHWEAKIDTQYIFQDSAPKLLPTCRVRTSQKNRNVLRSDSTTSARSQNVAASTGSDWALLGCNREVQILLGSARRQR